MICAGSLLTWPICVLIATTLSRVEATWSTSCQNTNSGRGERVAVECIFDPEWYLFREDDLQTPFGNDYDAAYQHFLNHGIKEGRKGSLLFDPVFYVDRTNDFTFENLTALYGTDPNTAALYHYLDYGIKEGRQASPVFDARFYTQRYDDVSTPENNWKDAAGHFLRIGIREGRQGSIISDPVFYRYHYNTDAVADEECRQFGSGYKCDLMLYAKFGTFFGLQGSIIYDPKHYNSVYRLISNDDYNTLLLHFLTHGIDEGNEGSRDFDPAYYTGHYSDLSGMSSRDSALHFLKFGIYEQRVAAYRATACDNPDSSRYNVCIDAKSTGNYNRDWTLDLTHAQQKWENIITGDLPPYTPGIPLVLLDLFSCKTFAYPIDDLSICAVDADLDGEGKFLADAIPISFREDSGLPAYGILRFDSADIDRIMQNPALWNALVTHEIGHILGIGPLWWSKGLVSNIFNPEYSSSTRACQEWQEIAGTGCPDCPPVEGNGGLGTYGVHWDEEALGSEMMTGLVEADSPISKVTVGSLFDMGYAVDFSKADPYSPGACTRSEFIPEISEEGLDDAVNHGLSVLGDMEARVRSSTIGTYIEVLYEEDGHIFSVGVSTDG